MNRPLSLLALAAGALVLSRAARRRAFDLQGKSVLITGASRGLGLVLARRLARAGARLTILARDAGELRRAEEELADLGAPVLALRVDVTDPLAVQEAVRQAAARHGRLDVLINNAGTIAVGPLDTMALADYREAMEVNFFGALHGMMAAREVMRAQGGGRIVNVSSIGGKVAVPHLVPYSASKFALTGLSEGWRAELLAEGILVTTACPGLIRTGSPRHADFGGRAEEEYAWFALADNLPLLSQSAEACADEILDALRLGRGEVVTGLPGKVLATAHALAPGLSATLSGLAARLLPDGGGAGSQKRKGFQSETDLTRNFAPKARAEAANNQR